MTPRHMMRRSGVCTRIGQKTPVGLQMGENPGTTNASWNDTPDPAQRRHNVVQLHADGRSVASIAEYLQVSKQTVYTVLKRWAQEEAKGLDDKSHARDEEVCVE